MAFFTYWTDTKTADILCNPKNVGCWIWSWIHSPRIIFYIFIYILQLYFTLQAVGLNLISTIWNGILNFYTNSLQFYGLFYSDMR